MMVVMRITMNIIKQMSSVVLLLASVVLIAIVAVVAFPGSGEVKQPIAFNHKKHVENNVSCAVCHQFYDKSAKAGIPDVEICKRCHEDVVYVSSEKQKLLHFVNAREEIPWQQVYEVPQHVLFSHKRHVVAGKLECSQCHGDVAQIVAPITTPAVKLDMDGCIDCHRTAYKNPNECLMCHR